MKPLSEYQAIIPAFAVAIVAGFAPSAFGMTLNEAIETALDNNPNLKSLESGADSAKYMSDAAKASLLPKIEITESYSRTNNPMYAFGSLLNQERISQNDFDPIKLNSPEAIDNFQTSVSLRMPLYAGGRLRGEIDKSKSFIKVSHGKLEKSRQEITARVVETWLNLNLLMERESVLADNARVADENLAKTNDRVELGMALKSEALDMMIERDRTDQQLNETVAARKTTLSLLKSLLGLPQESSLKPLFGVYRVSEHPGNLHALQNEATESRQEVKVINRQIEIARHERKIAKGGYLPEVSVAADYSLNQERLGSDAGDSWQFGVMARWNIYSGGRDLAKVKATTAKLNELKLKKEWLKREIKIQVERQYYQFETSRHNLEISKKRIDLAKESLRITKKRFEQGLMTGSDILASETQYKKARLNYLEAKNQVLLISSSLDVAIGRATTSIMEITR